MTAKEQMIEVWLATGEKNLADFERTPFHDMLNNSSRDHWTDVFENHPGDALKRLSDLLSEAKISEDQTKSINKGHCWELGLNTPRKVKFKGRRDYAYRFITAILTTTPLSPKNVVRHLCHNRNCVCPDHLLVGTHQQNYQDELNRR